MSAIDPGTSTADDESRTADGSADDTVLDARVRAWLTEARIVRIATVSPSGLPNVAPYWFSTDGVRIFVASSDNATVRNVRANGRVALLVDLGETFEDLRGAIIHARAVAHAAGDAPPDVEEGIRAMRAVHARERASEAFARYGRWDTRPGVYLEIIPEHASWFDLGIPASGRTPSPDTTGPSSGAGS